MLKVKCKKVVSAFLAAFMASTLINVMPISQTDTAYAATSTFKAEGEQYSSLNTAAATHTNDPALSKVKLLDIDTTTLPTPDNAILATYNITVPSAGAYYLDFAGGKVSDNGLSPIDVKVNSGSYLRLNATNTTAYGTIISSVFPNLLAYNRLNTTYNLAAGANTITFKIDQHPASYPTKYIFLLDYVAVSAKPLVPKSISYTKPLGIFQTGESVTAQLDFYQTDTATNQVSYTVTNYSGQTAASGNVTVPASSSSVQIPLGALANGHYTLQATLVDYDIPLTSYFAVVPSYAQRPVVNDSVFAMDTALTFTTFKLPNWSDPLALDYAQAVKLTGVKTVRERHRWNNNTNPSSGTFNFNAFNFDTYFNALNQNGINVLNDYIYSPDWTKRAGSPNITGSLKAAYDFAKAGADYYGNKIQAWEMYNEPELSSTANNESPDRMASYIKAVSVGLKDSATKPLVSLPGIAYPPASYVDTLMQNQLDQYINIYNFHAHKANDVSRNIMSLPPAVAQNMDYMDQYNIENKQAWLSEAGSYITLAGDKAEITYDEQKKQARYFVTSTVQSLATGVNKHFAFCFPYYIESNRQLGIMTFDHRPKAAYTAVSVLTNSLGAGKYAGSIKNMPSGAEGHAFTDGSYSVMALWSETAQNTLIDLPQTTAELIDIMGNKQTVSRGTSGYTLQLGPDPIYVRVSGALPQSAYTAKTYPAKTTETLTFTPAQKVILEQIYPDSVSAVAKNIGYKLPNATPTTVSVEVNNLNNAAMSGTVQGTVFGGLQLSPASQSISLAAYEKKALTFTLTPTSSIKYNTTLPVIFNGTFSGQKTSDSVAKVLVENNATVTVDKTMPNYAASGAWSVNHSSGTTTGITYPASGNVRFVFTFPAGSQWAYPKLSVPAGTDFRDSKGLVLNLNAAAAVTADAGLKVIINENNGSQYIKLNGVALSAGDQQIRIPWEQFSPSGGGVGDDNFHLDLDQFKVIQVGFNSTSACTRDITITGFGVYNEPDSGVYTKFTYVTPGDGSTVTATSLTASATITAGQIEAVPSTIRVELDGNSVSSAYDAATRRITAPLSGLINGTHKITFCYFDTSNRAVKTTTTITTPLKINAESATTNFTPFWLPQSSLPEVDGSQLLQVKIVPPSPLPSGGAKVTFSFNAPAAGTYKFEAVTNNYNPNVATYYSPYNIKVNSGSYNLIDASDIVTATPLHNTTTGQDLTKYQYNDITLNAGNNTIEFMVDTLSISQSRYVLNVDYIQLTKVPANITPIKIEAESAATNFTPFWLPQSSLAEIDGPQMLQVKIVPPSPLPTGGAKVTFSFNAPVAGTYKFEAVTNNYDPNIATYYSPYNIKVNAGSYNLIDSSDIVTATPLHNTTTGQDMTRYRYSDITLNEGTNTIEFMVDTLSKSVSRYVFNVDYIVLTKN